MKIWKLGAPLLALGLVAGGLTACSSNTSSDQADQYARVCVDKDTNERVTGDRCGTDDNHAADGFLWYYLLYGRALPAYGYHVSGGVTHVNNYVVVQHAERLAPKGGLSYEKAPNRTYTTGGGMPLKSSTGGSGYKGPAVRPPAPKPASGGGYKAPSSGGGYKAPSSGYKAPAPAAPRFVSPPRVSTRFR
jgi:hypothetical protein